ncbi:MULTISPECIES: substrate-binding periplasmic protein [unclassified Vibrio]|uniref:substrate-binding periplasmic protein n=2 Tax=Vibrio TaxID=662 RepID=UPI002F3E2D0A
MRWLIIALLSNACWAYYPPTSVTVYGDDSYPPYSYSVDGELRGIYVDILLAAFERMPEYRIKVSPVPWKRGLKLLETGEGFALFPPYYYPDQRLYISPYSHPILDEEVVVYCQPDRVKDRQLNVWPDDYLGLTVGVNDSFALGGNEFWQQVKKGTIKLIEAKGNRNNVLNLYKNRIDCYLNDRLSILWEVKLLREEGIINSSWKMQLGNSVSSEQGYVGFTNQSPDKYPYKDEFIQQLNTIITYLKEDGTIDEILKKYLEL